MKKFILLILLMFLLTGCGKENKVEQKDLNEYNSQVKEEINNNLENNNQDNNINNSNEETDIKNELVENNDSIDNSNNEIDNTINYSSEDKIVIEKIENINKEVDTLIANENNEDAKNKAKGIFIMLVDFIFYDGEIKGVTFDSLTNAGKTKVLKLVNTIDEKIEKHFPNYKENINEKTSSAFLKASELIKKGANNIKEFAKEKLGEKYYQDIINSKDEFVLYTKNVLSIVSEYSSSLFNSLKDKLSKWYEEFKNKN